jgi:phage shock protein A
MADPFRHSNLNTYLQRAEQAAADADAATLENVRQRFLRAEAAWRALAESAERSQRIRADEFARIRAAIKPACEAAPDGKR